LVQSEEAPLQIVPVISIIDDDESMRLATESLIKTLGFSAYSFPSAEAFLLSPRLNDSDCIISDVQMPAMGGLELQQALKARGLPTPLIFITAYPRESVERRARAEGAVCYLQKPFEVQDLIKCIERALDRNSG
jgi:FixJ family two-component response regulator